jgi:hypothetical protein
MPVYEMKPIVHGFVYAFIILYIIYALFQIGLAGLLFSFAIGLILHSFEFSLELTTAIAILSGLLWKMLLGKKTEGFQAPTGKGQSLQDVVKKIAQIQKPYVQQPSAVLSSTFAEGFADAGTSDKTIPTPESNTTPGSNNTSKEDSKPSSASSVPASTSSPTITPQLLSAVPNAKQASGFTDKVVDGMFKLGSIPPDAAGGAHIDVGTTLMNALNSLKPDQVKQMTDDSRKLMETQKTLMGMLGTMKPMLEDGKQLMETFQEMFGNIK